MSSVSQKCQYALRAVFELAARQSSDGKPVAIADIAAAQAIPPRFLELILNELKQSGLLESRRGAAGGYLLASDPRELTVQQVITLVDGPIEPVKCVAGKGVKCPLKGGCAFEDMWKEAGQAMAGVFDKTTFQDLLDRRHKTGSARPSYVI